MTTKNGNSLSNINNSNTSVQPATEPASGSKGTLRILPLGGVGEVGKNMLLIEYGDDILIVDAGLMFPEEEMLGIDLVIPDISYLLDKRERVRGIIVTHGHEDHIGALPYILPYLQNVPIYGTRLTQGLVTVKLKEHRLLDTTRLISLRAGESITLGVFSIELIHVCHSIPDAVGLAIKTPVGTVIHTSDFKFDQTPIDGELTDMHRLAALGGEGVLALLSDTVRVEQTGFTPSERVVGEMFDAVFAQAPGRVIITTFASNISRIQQALDCAYRYGRKVAIVGRSMENNAAIARDLGYLDMPPNTLIKIDEANKLSPEMVVFITTGSQGEPTSALSRIATNEHRQLKVIPGDTVIISATPVPGNEGSIARTINNLFKRGANVIYSSYNGRNVHVSGHASRDELKLMINLTRPKYLLPMHGEYRHLVLYSKMATEEMNFPGENIFIAENGQAIEFDAEGNACIGPKVAVGSVLVDGLSVGDISQVVLRDRQLLSRDGILIVVVALDKQTGQLVGGPDIVSRGYVDIGDSDRLFENAKAHVRTTLTSDGDGAGANIEYAFLGQKIKDSLSKFLYEQTKRRPLILPVITEV